jgi:cytochrome bd-type quinol oxidase subunit 2
MSTNPILGAIDPAGPFAAVCGITWTFMAPTSGVSALVSAALCPFERTVRQAHRLSTAALWSGLAALTASVVGTVATAGWKEGPKESTTDAVLLILVTRLCPLLAIFTSRWSRRKLAAIPQPLPAEPGAPPNGGPAERFGNSGAGGGPPSVS